MLDNLNDLCVEHHDLPPQQLGDSSVSSGSVTVFFRDLEGQLLKRIRAADMVVGCVAWLTSSPVLQGLSGVKHGVSIVVQKEDFLRPDVGVKSGWKAWLRKQYEALPKPPERHKFDGFVSKLSVCCDPTIEPVRCVGNHNREKKPASPRMHNKFLVFCKKAEAAKRFTPYAVWTGSFNLTRNATMSLENALLITDPTIAAAYYSEWEQILALSEPLNWTEDWAAPEWRIGS